MKEYLKETYHWIVLLAQTIVSFLLILFFNHGKSNREFKRFRNKCSCQSVSILGNGPSMKDLLHRNVGLLKYSDLVVVNYFANSDGFFFLRPKYYILLDPSFFVKEYGVSSEINAKSNEPLKTKLKDNLKLVDWEMILFVPYTSTSKKAINDFVDNPKIKVEFFYATQINGFECFQNWMYARNQGLPSSKNVLIPAIMLMLNVGYKKIYLYGAEFSWTKTMDVDIDNGMMFFNDKHYYSKEEIRYFNKGGYKWWLDSIVKMLDATERVAKYAEKINAVVINRTKGSFIDAFKYEKID